MKRKGVPFKETTSRILSPRVMSHVSLPASLESTDRKKTLLPVSAYDRKGQAKKATGRRPFGQNHPASVTGAHLAGSFDGEGPGPMTPVTVPLAIVLHVIPGERMVHLSDAQWISRGEKESAAFFWLAEVYWNRNPSKKKDKRAESTGCNRAEPQKWGHPGSPHDFAVMTTICFRVGMSRFSLNIHFFHCAGRPGCVCFFCLHIPGGCVFQIAGGCVCFLCEASCS